MRVGIAGAGAIGMAYAAYLQRRDHSPSIWSPSGARTEALVKGDLLQLTGKFEGRFTPAVCEDAKALAASDVIILALPAYGYRTVLQALIPHIEPRHIVIFSGHLSFAALFLSKQLAMRGIEIPIVAWNTTALTAKAPLSPMRVHVGAIRARIDMATIPRHLSRQAVEICASLFGDRFRPADDLLTIALSNLNPQNHLGIALCNFTRMERGEDWCQNTNVTPGVANFLIALDKERLRIARAFGKSVRSIQDTMAAALEASNNTVAEMYELQVARGTNPLGPKTLDTRYVLEDVPFGLVPTLMLARMANIAAPLHKSGVDILSACYGCDLVSKNDLLEELGSMDLASIARLASDGYPAGD